MLRRLNPPIPPRIPLDPCASGIDHGVWLSSDCEAHDGPRTDGSPRRIALRAEAMGGVSSVGRHGESSVDRKW